MGRRWTRWERSESEAAEVLREDTTIKGLIALNAKRKTHRGQMITAHDLLRGSAKRQYARSGRVVIKMHMPNTYKELKELDIERQRETLIYFFGLPKEEQLLITDVWKVSHGPLCLLADKLQVPVPGRAFPYIKKPRKPYEPRNKAEEAPTEESEGNEVIDESSAAQAEVITPAAVTVINEDLTRRIEHIEDQQGRIVELLETLLARNMSMAAASIELVTTKQQQTGFTAQQIAELKNAGLL